MDIKRLRELCDKATPGPWEVVKKGNTVPSLAIPGVCSGLSPKKADAEFIAAARTALPEALEQLEWHEINQKQLEDQCDRLIDENDSLIKQIASLGKSLHIACEGLKEVQDD